MQPRFIFMSGGLSGQDMMPFNAVERYDSMRDTWERFPSLNMARSMHSSCTIGNMLYVIGGRDSGSQEINSIEKLVNIDGPINVDV